MAAGGDLAVAGIDVLPRAADARPLRGADVRALDLTPRHRRVTRRPTAGCARLRWQRSRARRRTCARPFGAGGTREDPADASGRMRWTGTCRTTRASCARRSRAAPPDGAARRSASPDRSDRARRRARGRAKPRRGDDWRAVRGALHQALALRGSRDRALRSARNARTTRAGRCRRRSSRRCRSSETNRASSRWRPRSRDAGAGRRDWQHQLAQAFHEHREAGTDDEAPLGAAPGAGKGTRTRTLGR